MTPKNPVIVDRVTVPMLVARKGKKPIVMITAYDAPQGRLVDAAGADAILIGDSIGMTTLGYDTTIPVTVDDIVLSTRAVVRGQIAGRTDRCPERNENGAAGFSCERQRGARSAIVIADLPFGSYGASVEDGVRAGMRLVAEGGAQSVKLEGAGATALESIRRLSDAGVPVIGHLGLTPQSVHRFGGFKLQAKSDTAADALLRDAESLVEAGVWGIVLEMIPAALAQRVTDAVAAVTIGIGAGAGCDGQVQVIHDLIGLTFGPVFRHSRRYAETASVIERGLNDFVTEVRERRFPGEENSF